MVAMLMERLQSLIRGRWAAWFKCSSTAVKDFLMVALLRSCFPEPPFFWVFIYLNSNCTWLCSSGPVSEWSTAVLEWGWREEPQLFVGIAGRGCCSACVSRCCVLFTKRPGPLPAEGDCRLFCSDFLTAAVFKWLGLDGSYFGFFHCYCIIMLGLAVNGDIYISWYL